MGRGEEKIDRDVAELAMEDETTMTEVGKPLILLICGTLVYYYCVYRNSSFLSLISDVFIVLFCFLAILGMLFCQMNISVLVDPLEWKISLDTANVIFAWLANTLGATESVLRVAAARHERDYFLRLFSFFTCNQLWDEWPQELQLLMQYGFGAYVEDLCISNSKNSVSAQKRISIFAPCFNLDLQTC